VIVDEEKTLGWKGKISAAVSVSSTGPSGFSSRHRRYVSTYPPLLKGALIGASSYSPTSHLAEGTGSYLFAPRRALWLRSGTKPQAESNALVDESGRSFRRHRRFSASAELFHEPGKREAARPKGACKRPARRSEGRKLTALLEALVSIAKGNGESVRGPLDSVLGIVASSWGLGYEAKTSEGPCADSWQVLGLEPGSSREEVKRVFRVLASQFHPDGGAALTAVQRRETEEAFKRIKDAYDDCMRSFSSRGG
jgi:hypothetical protein